MHIVKNLRTHYAVLRDSKKIPLTEEQYNRIVLAKQDAKPSEFINLVDPDTNKSLYHGEIGAIKEFEEIKRQNMLGRRYFCDYGISHFIHEDCNCKLEYNIAPAAFRSMAIEVAGKYLYNDEITEEIRKNVLKKHAQLV